MSEVYNNAHFHNLYMNGHKHPIQTQRKSNIKNIFKSHQHHNHSATKSQAHYTSYRSDSPYRETTDLHNISEHIYRHYKKPGFTRLSHMNLDHTQAHHKSLDNPHAPHTQIHSTPPSQYTFKASNTLQNHLNSITHIKHATSHMSPMNTYPRLPSPPNYTQLRNTVHPVQHSYNKSETPLPPTTCQSSSSDASHSASSMLPTERDSSTPSHTATSSISNINEFNGTPSYFSYTSNSSMKQTNPSISTPDSQDPKKTNRLNTNNNRPKDQHNWNSLSEIETQTVSPNHHHPSNTNYRLAFIPNAPINNNTTTRTRHTSNNSEVDYNYNNFIEYSMMHNSIPQGNSQTKDKQLAKNFKRCSEQCLDKVDNLQAYNIGPIEALSSHSNVNEQPQPCLQIPKNSQHLYNLVPICLPVNMIVQDDHNAYFQGPFASNINHVNNSAFSQHTQLAPHMQNVNEKSRSTGGESYYTNIPHSWSQNKNNQSPSIKKMQHYSKASNNNSQKQFISHLHNSLNKNYTSNSAQQNNRNHPYSNSHNETRGFQIDYMHHNDGFVNNNMFKNGSNMNATQAGTQNPNTCQNTSTYYQYTPSSHNYNMNHHSHYTNQHPQAHIQPIPYDINSPNYINYPANYKNELNYPNSPLISLSTSENQNMQHLNKTSNNNQQINNLSSKNIKQVQNSANPLTQPQFPYITYLPVGGYAHPLNHPEPLPYTLLKNPELQSTSWIFLPPEQLKLYTHTGEYMMNPSTTCTPYINKPNTLLTLHDVNKKSGPIMKHFEKENSENPNVESDTESKENTSNSANTIFEVEKPTLVKNLNEEEIPPSGKMNETRSIRFNRTTEKRSSTTPVPFNPRVLDKLLLDKITQKLSRTAVNLKLDKPDQPISNEESLDKEELEENITTIMPPAKLDGNVIFDRKIKNQLPLDETLKGFIPTMTTHNREVEDVDKNEPDTTIDSTCTEVSPDKENDGNLTSINTNSIELNQNASSDTPSQFANTSDMTSFSTLTSPAHTLSPEHSYKAPLDEHNENNYTSLFKLTPVQNSISDSISSPDINSFSQPPYNTIYQSHFNPNSAYIYPAAPPYTTINSSNSAINKPHNASVNQYATSSPSHINSISHPTTAEFIYPTSTTNNTTSTAYLHSVYTHNPYNATTYNTTTVTTPYIKPTHTEMMGNTSKLAFYYQPPPPPPNDSLHLTPKESYKSSILHNADYNNINHNHMKEINSPKSYHPFPKKINSVEVYNNFQNNFNRNKTPPNFNLHSFFIGTTPATIIPSSYRSHLWHFPLKQLWESFEESSTYGIEIPFINFDGQMGALVCVPFVSAIVLYSREEPDKPCFKYIEIDKPHRRKPFDQIIKDLLAQGKSNECGDPLWLSEETNCLSDRSWIAIYWKTMHREFNGSQSPAFLVFYWLKATCIEKNGVAFLSRFGVIPDKIDLELWAYEADTNVNQTRLHYEKEKASLKQWLRSNQIEHSDFEHFSNVQI